MQTSTGTQIIVKKLPAVSGITQAKLVPKSALLESALSEGLDGELGGSGRSSPVEGAQASGPQAKANRIIQEAIAKAEAEGRPIPKVGIIKKMALWLRLKGSYYCS